MKQTRTAKRREAAINSVKILLTSASLAATVGGWAVISASSGAAVDVAALGSTGVNSTATVQAFLDSRSTPAVDSSATPAAAATSASAGSTNPVSTVSDNSLPAATATTAPTATVAPTATAVPTQVVVQRVIRTRSSR